MEVVGFIFALPPIVENCIDAATFIRDCIQSDQLLLENKKSAIKTMTGITTTLEAVKSISARYGFSNSEQNYVQDNLDELFDVLSAMEARFKAWDASLSGGSVTKKTMASIRIAFSKDQIKSRIDKVQVYLGSLGTYVLVIATSRKPLELMEPQSLIPESLSNEQSPAELINAVSILMAKQNQRQGLVREISSEELGEQANYVSIGTGVAFGRDMADEFEDCIFDHRTVRVRTEAKAVLEDTKRLAALLSDPLHDHKDHGLLQCLGYVDRGVDNGLELVFKKPSTAAIGTPPRLLRTLLADGTRDGAQHSLNNRVKFAIKLSHAVLLLHAAGLIHKNIRPDSVFVSDHVDSFPGDQSLGTPYLLAFGETRGTERKSSRARYIDIDLYKRVYHHPIIQHPDRPKQYARIHDIYSLGVCLLEVAVWKSFFKLKDPVDDSKATTCQWINDTVVVDLLESPEAMKQNKGRPKPAQIQEMFVHMAKEVVPRIMGVTYSEVVVTCLTGFNNTTPDEADVGRLFCEQVMDKLKSVRL